MGGLAEKEDDWPSGSLFRILPKLVYTILYTRGPTNAQKPGLFPRTKKTWFVDLSIFVCHGMETEGRWELVSVPNRLNKACN